MPSARTSAAMASAFSLTAYLIVVVATCFFGACSTGASRSEVTPGAAEIGSLRDEARGTKTTRTYTRLHTIPKGMTGTSLTQSQGMDPAEFFIDPTPVSPSAATNTKQDSPKPAKRILAKPRVVRPQAATNQSGPAAQPRGSDPYPSPAPVQ